jgi:hypothetical protein
LRGCGRGRSHPTNPHNLLFLVSKLVECIIAIIIVGKTASIPHCRSHGEIDGIVLCLRAN